MESGALLRACRGARVAVEVAGVAGCGGGRAGVKYDGVPLPIDSVPVPDAAGGQPRCLCGDVVYPEEQPGTACKLCACTDHRPRPAPAAAGRTAGSTAAVKGAG